MMKKNTKRLVFGVLRLCTTSVTSGLRSYSSRLSISKWYNYELSCRFACNRCVVKWLQSACVLPDVRGIMRSRAHGVPDSSTV